LIAMVLFFLFLILPLGATASDYQIQFSQEIPDYLQTNAQRLIAAQITAPRGPVSAFRLEQYQRRIADLVEEAAKPYGFFSAQCQIQTPQQSPNLIFYVDCQLNKPVRITEFSIEISGPGEALLTPMIQSQTLLARGQVFRADDYDTQKSQLLEISRRFGFLSASTQSSQLTIHPDRYSAQIKLQLDTGPRYQFGPIYIPNNVYDPDYLRSFADFKPGMMYDEALLSAYKNNLESTNLFSYVTVLPFSGAFEDRQIPTQVFYEPTPRLQYGVGVGITSSNDFFYSATIRRNRLSRRGMQSTTELLSSNQYRYFVTTLSIPRTHPTKDYNTIRLSYRYNDIDFVGTDQNLTLSVSHVLVTRPTQYRMQRREWSVNYALDQSQYDGASKINNQFLYPKVEYTQQFNHPQRRINLQLTQDIMANFRPLLTPADFIRVVMTQKLHYRILPKLSALVRFKQGVVRTSGDEDQLPIGWFFYTGGAYSIRGFEFNSIGADPNDNARTNNYLYQTSLELQRAISSDLYGLVFIDSGDAFTQWSDTRASYAVGSGIMWQSFVGNLEVSVAWPLRNHSSNPSLSPRLNFRIYQPI
jgi:translocation and assembly module TamA